MVVLNIFHVLIAIAMVALVLVQRGAGATAGAAFGSGASGTVFGARGAGTFLTKSTWVLAVLFCAISLVIAVMVSRMDASPEANLGVISAAAQETESVNEEMATESGPQAVESVQEDLPTLQIGEDQAGQAMSEQEQADGDVPAVDSEAVESTDNNQDGTATGTDSDDS